jgi:ribulose kinase
MDMRSADQAAQVLATGDVAVEVNSGGKGPVSAEWMIGKALWIKQNEPELYKVCSGICSGCRHDLAVLGGFPWNAAACRKMADSVSTAIPVGALTPQMPAFSL